MAQTGMDRKAFMRTVGRGAVGTCMCGAALGAQAALGTGLHAQENASQQAQAKLGERSPARAAKRMEFVDVWVPRFFAVMDAELDEATRRRVMVANGKVCFSKFRPDLKARPQAATREQIAEWVARRGTASGYSMDGDVVSFEYVGSAETGQAAPARVCLCPVAEGQAARQLSPTFCWCSVGYVKEMHERAFGRPVNVELTESVLMGNPRCRFRITTA